MPISERSIEAKHSLAKRGVHKASRPSPALFSLAVRFPGVLEAIEHDRYFIDELSDHFEKARRSSALVGNLGLTEHPALNAWVSEYGRILRKHVTLCMYHCDLPSMYLDHSDLKARVSRGDSSGRLVRRRLRIRNLCRRRSRPIIRHRTVSGQPRRRRRPPIRHSRLRQRSRSKIRPRNMHVRLLQNIRCNFSA